MLQATYHCARCLVDQATHAVELATADPAARREILAGVLRIVARAYPGEVPARLGTRIHTYVMDRTGRDPYAALKERSNRVAREAADRLRERNPDLRARVQAAVAGNAIDFGVDGSREALDSLGAELARGLTVDHFDRFRGEVERARRILYLTDNCGEAALDLLLVEALAGEGKEVTVSPKEEPILNDATVADLEALGFGRVARIVPHARRSIGLVLSEAPGPLLRAWEEADLVVAKGMGHFETLYGTDKNAAFLLKAKCIPVAESLGVAPGSHVLTF